MKPYHLTLFAYPAQEIVASFHMVTTCLIEEFQKLGHVKLSVVDVMTDPMAQTVKPCDFVLAHTLFGKPYPFSYDPRKLPCRKRALLLESPSPLFDHCFVFQPVYYDRNIETLIEVPCPKSRLRNVPKDDRTVLLDHAWPPIEDRGLDRCKWIYRALEPCKDEFLFTQLDHFGVWWDAPPWVKRLSHQPMPAYLEATEHFGTFIVTHQESWGHSLADMAARGIRILAPPDFVRPEMLRLLRPDVFTTSEGLRALLRAPINHAAWDRRIDNCTGFDEICAIIDRKFQTWL